MDRKQGGKVSFNVASFLVEEGERETNAPSSTLMSTFASGLRAITAMFFRFSKAKVDDLLLYHRSQTSGHSYDTKIRSDALDQIKNRDPVPHRAQNRVPIRREYDVALAVDRPAEIGELLGAASIHESTA